jgi:hypothetical protein
MAGNGTLTLTSSALPGIQQRFSVPLTMPANLNNIVQYATNGCRPEDNCRAGIRICAANTNRCIEVFGGSTAEFDVSLLRELQGQRRVDVTSIGRAAVSVPVVTGIVP